MNLRSSMSPLRCSRSLVDLALKPVVVVNASLSVLHRYRGAGVCSGGRALGALGALGAVGALGALGAMSRSIRHGQPSTERTARRQRRQRFRSPASTFSDCRPTINQGMAAAVSNAAGPTFTLRYL